LKCSRNCQRENSDSAGDHKAADEKKDQLSTKARSIHSKSTLRRRQTSQSQEDKRRSRAFPVAQNIYGGRRKPSGLICPDDENGAPNAAVCHRFLL
jgi:hypothetical protein